MIRKLTDTEKCILKQALTHLMMHEAEIVVNLQIEPDLPRRCKTQNLLHAVTHDGVAIEEHNEKHHP